MSKKNEKVETPISLGCPALVPPRMIPHDEPASKVPDRDGPRTDDAGNALADWIIRNGALYDIPQFVIEQAGSRRKGGAQ